MIYCLYPILTNQRSERVAKKRRGAYRLNGVGTRVEQHAERAVRLAKMDAMEAKIHACQSLSFLKRRAPEQFEKLIEDAELSKLYERFEEKNLARQAAAATQIVWISRTGEVAAERRRRKLSLNGEGTPCEQHIDRVKRLWSVLLERNHNLHQARTRKAFAESMKWLEENEPNAFQTLIESLKDRTNGDDAYFIYVRHELTQTKKAFEAENGKQGIG